MNRDRPVICRRCARPVRPGTGAPLPRGARIHRRRLTLRTIEDREPSGVTTARVIELMTRNQRVIDRLRYRPGHIRAPTEKANRLPMGIPLFCPVTRTYFPGSV